MIGKRALELGFTSTVGIIHDGDGQLQPLAERRARSLLRHARHGKEQLRAHQLLPGQHRARQGKPLAMPRRLALPLYLRGRPGALLLAAARLPGQAAGANTPSTTSAANTAPPKAAPRAAPWLACTRSRTSISGAASKTCTSTAVEEQPKAWCRSASVPRCCCAFRVLPITNPVRVTVRIPCNFPAQPI